MPTVLRSVDGPVQGSALELVVIILELRMMREKEPSHGSIALERSPMQGRRVVLAEGIHGQTRVQHQTDCVKVIVSRRMGHVPAACGWQPVSQVKILR